MNRQDKRRKEREEKKITETLNHAYVKYENPRRTMRVEQEKELNEVVMQEFRNHPKTAPMMQIMDMVGDAYR